MITKGQKVRIAYELTVDGHLVRSIQKTKPFGFVYGKRCADIPSGLEKALKRLKVGERMSVDLPPRQGYGASNAKSILEVSKKRLSKKFHFVGKAVTSGSDGKFLATVREVRKDTVLLDFNHPLAGKTLSYDVLMVSIEGQAWA